MVSLDMDPFKKLQTDNYIEKINASNGTTNF